MKSLAPDIVEYATTSLTILDASAEAIVQEGSGSDAHAESAISNVKLLLRRLIEFYGDANNADYFPHHGDLAVSKPLELLVEALEEFQASPEEEHAVKVVMLADQLYTAALRLGLISFGLGANEMKALVEELGAKQKAVKKIASAVEKKSDEIISKATEALDKATVALDTGGDVTELRKALAEGLEKCKSELQQLLAATEEGEVHLKTSEESSSQAVSSAEEAATAATEARADAKTVSELSKSGQAALELLQQARATAKEELDEIIAFYGELEQHKKAMLDAKKEAEAKFNELAERHRLLQGKCEDDTKKIIQENVDIQVQIKEHLQKAVGVSLFHAFDARSRSLSWGKWMWAVVLVISVVAGALLSWWLADSLKGATASPGIEPVFFVKLSAIIPITFAIFFAARQYGNERRAEEEYAFKSVISVSLEPYKDLLHKMKTDGHAAQALFVEKLLLEIFDNPVSRVYSDHSDKKAKLEKAMTLKEIRSIVSISKDLDVEKVKQLVDILGGGLPSK